MSGNHPVLRIVGGLALCGLLLFTLAGAAVISAGSIQVSVRDKGPDGFSLAIPVPVNLASAVLTFIPDRELEEIRAGFGPWMPAIEAALDGLARCPDGPLVEVDSADETVRIVKRGGKLVIDVDSRDETVHVAVPIRGALKLVRQLAA
jgi:hypothetical protein